MRKIIILLLVVIAFTSCTDNQRARHFGGSERITLNPNEIVLNVTWKEYQMWICTKDTVTGIVYFREKSNWGILEGTIILK